MQPDSSSSAIWLAFLSIAVTVVLFLIGALMRQSSRQHETVARGMSDMTRSIHEQDVILAGVDATLRGVVTRVDQLHEWKNEQQRREMTRLEEEIAAFKREKEQRQ